MTEGGRAYQDKGREREGGRGRAREKKGERVCVMTIVIFVMNRVSSSHAFGVRYTLLRSVPHSHIPVLHQEKCNYNSIACLCKNIYFSIA